MALEMPERAAPSLGDCILHLTHHEMTGECWEACIEFYMAVAEEWMGRPGGVDMDAFDAEVVARYKASYERGLLVAMSTLVAHGEQPPTPATPEEGNRHA